ncbi:unnamed protein product [Tilletia controversa]|uniref:Carboxymuconolactone decarboxylase-like domain-containing protein n=1 Tax=Tilletia controversa TaxID=13291 RepID=A0A8X7SWI1_9BASI|nr:hypothetical protein CF328_g4179 [Tilletia controversa]KAE8246351.1 hypothetical protein A4X06_0g5049 [Tilletia controversa]CAD6900887.1 unnamed protein product [Tilletia controversa]CAD6917476.1 unnamed protein product [Tilletia controversa]CAD6929864.1 unnamed protein product [Tilletia controversa]
MSITADDIRALKSHLHPSLHAREWYTVLTAATSAARIGAQAVPLIWQIAKEEIGSELRIEGADSNSGSETTVDDEAVLLQRRIKEALLKGSVLFGIPAALDPLFALSPLLRADAAAHPARSDTDFFLRRGRAHEDSLTPLAHDGLRRVYRHNLDEILENKFAKDNMDIQFLTMEINYGWNLAEYSILDFPSTELVILAALLPIPAVPAQTMWHLRGCRRAGWSDDVIESVRQTSFALVELCRERGIGMYSWDASRVPSLQDVKEDSNE